MGWLEDLLKEVPLSAVMKERVQLAADKLALATEQNESLKQRIRALEKENRQLREQIPKESPDSLSHDTSRVLVYLFQAPQSDDCHVEAIAHALEIDEGVIRYHLDQLKDAGFADVRSANYIHGHVYWGLTPAGRRHVVENNLHSSS
jgi:DNA-binding MarR family transcriptional regulator